MRRCIPSPFFKPWALGFGVLILFLSGNLPSFAQSVDLQTQINAHSDGAVREITARWDRLKDKEQASPESAIRLALDKHQQSALYALLLASASAPKAVDSFKADVDEARVDKQVGSNSGTAGSTSLASKGSVPAILGFAVENGSLDRSASGTTITFTGRPVQIIQSFQKTSFTDSYKQIEQNPALGFLNRFAFSLSFDTSRGGQAGTFTGNGNQFSALTLHIDLLNERDPRNKRYNSRWLRLQTGVGQDLALSLYNVYDQILSTPAFEARFEQWLNDTILAIRGKVSAEDQQGVSDTLRQRLEVFPTADGIPGAENLLKSFADSTTTMLAARADVLSFIGTAPTVTFEYSDNRAMPASPQQVKLPDTSSFKLVAELAPFKGGSFTFNAGAHIFNAKPAGTVTNILRDLNASAQLDIPVNLSSVSKIGNVVVSLAGKYERIPQNAIPLTSGGSTATSIDAVLRGDMVIGQAKLTIPVKGSGVKIPVSFSVANRTELIKETDVRGNIGITFDLDTIIAKLKP